VVYLCRMILEEIASLDAQEYQRAALKQMN
jgi:hypothetical protein